MYGELAFTWDQRKNEENLRKHGFDFETALFVFKDPNLVKFRDEKHSANEDRWNVLGLVGTAVLFVVETEITDNIIRIISARKANKHEKEKYNDENRIS